MPTCVSILAGHALATVWVTVNDLVDIRFAVDTGSVFTFISQRAVARTGLELVGPFREIPLLTAERMTARVSLGRLQKVQLGTVTLQNVEAGFFPLPVALDIDGILGLNFLKRYRVTFEFDTSSLVLREFPARRPTTSNV